MKILSKFTFGLVILLTACHAKQDDELYYLQNPDKLAQAVIACQNKPLSQAETASHCRLVLDTTKTLLLLIAEQQAHPQIFGQHILNDQMAYAKLQTAWRQAKTPDEIEKTLNALRNKEREIQFKLAVVGLGSP